MSRSTGARTRLIAGRPIDIVACSVWHVDATNPAVVVVPAGSGAASTIRSLNQLYLHDLSERAGWDVGEDGRFADADVDGYWLDDRSSPFLIRVGGKLGGFAVVDNYSHLTGRPGVHDMAEFFVLRRYRRSRVGQRAARLLFERFPGVWEVREMRSNAAASGFWLSVIGELTGGVFENYFVERPEPLQVQSFTYPGNDRSR
jgi:predicted acetyltransferase